MERDKLAFLKGALTGNAAQVLWDTDRSTTNSLKKLVAVLKSRYSGERQAEKYRAELQIWRRKNQESLSELHQDIRRLTVLAYPKLTAEAREQIGCDHFTNALGDPDFVLKVKERAPQSLDEALCIALRLEAWAKSVKTDKKEDERPDRYRQKTRSTQHPQSNDRLTKIDADISKLHEEMKKLLEASKTPSIPTVNPAIPLTSVSVQRPATHATPSAGERGRPQIQNFQNSGPVRPLMSSSFPQQRQPPTCWNCNLPGHIIRDCPTRNRPVYGQAAGNNLAGRGSTKMQDQANVYLRMSLLGKEVPCLVDTVCELTLVPKDLIGRFTNIEVRPSIRHVWAADNTPIRIEGEVRLPLELDEKCLWTIALVSEDVEEVMLGIGIIVSGNSRLDSCVSTDNRPLLYLVVAMSNVDAF